MLISGKMSIAMLRRTNGVASTISIAMTMNVYGRRSASATTPRLSPLSPRLSVRELCPSAAGPEDIGPLL